MQEHGEQMFVRARWIWLGMLAAVGIYAVVAEIVAGSTAPANPVGSETYRYVLIGMAVMTFVGARLIKPLVTSGRLAGIIGPGGGPLGRLWVGSLLASVLSETVGVYGLMLFFLTGNRLDLYPLIGLALVSLVLARPRRHEWEEAARAEQI